MDASQAAESFRGLVLRHHGRTGLTQRDLAVRIGVGRRTVQDWEAGVNYPTTERLQALIQVLLEAGGLSAGHEAAEAQELWSAALHEAPRMHPPFDQEWFGRLLAARVVPPPAPTGDVLQAVPATAPGAGTVERVEDWGEAPDVLGFVGRAEELALLQRWVLDERCRLVALLGMGGIGKTSLAAKLAHDVAATFERLYWRSLRDAPPPGEWLTGVLGFLSDHQLVPPSNESEQIAVLLQLLRDRRFLLVLDNSEALFEPGQRVGRYRPGMASYGHLLHAVGDASHQSCMVLTSRETPPEFARLIDRAVRTLKLGGLDADQAQVLLAPKQLTGSGQQWRELNDRFGGNGLALKVVGETIRELFGRDIGEFLKEGAGGNVFGGIRRLLTEQIDRSSALEQQVLRVLAVDREPVRFSELLAALGPGVGRSSVLEAIEALRRRSLLERAEVRGAAAFTLQSVVLEYVTDRLVADVSDEIRRGQPVIVVMQPLIKAQAKDYVRQTQERMIGGPVLQQLRADRGEATAEQRLFGLLEGWRSWPPQDLGYGPGNVVNLLRLLRGNLRELDLSRLAIRQAYLAQVDAQDATLVDSHLAETVLAEAFYFPPSIALSGDAALLAAGTSTGEVWLWRVADRTPGLAVQAHTGVVFSVALSAAGHLLASAGGDGIVRLWETGTGHPVARLEGHNGAVWSVAMSADGHLVVSGGADGTVRLWDSGTGQPLATLHGHAGTVRDVAASADGHLVASSGDDGLVKLWETGTGLLMATLEGHSGTVWGLSLSAEGHLVASGGADGTVRLWESGTGQLMDILEGHGGTVWGVALSADGQRVASGGADGTVRLWEVSTAQPVATLPGHSGPVKGVALSADPQLVASGSFDASVKLREPSTGRTVATLQGLSGGVWGVALAADGWLLATGHADGTARIWETAIAVDEGTGFTAKRTQHFERGPAGGRPLATLQGHIGTVYSVALSADGQLVATSSDDGTVKVWQTSTGLTVATLEGHAGVVWGVALSADGHAVASGGGDGTVRIWDSSTGRPVGILQGHSGTVWSVALSADGRLVVSGGEDGTVRTWDTSTGQSVGILQGHSGTVWSVALSADGGLAASAGDDGAVRLWDSGTGRLSRIIQGHSGTAYGVALSADGRLVVSGGADGTVRLWDSSTGQPIATMHGHTGTIRDATVSANGQLVASGGFDGTVKLWDPKSGACLRTVRPERRYERLDITGLTGVTSAQRTALLALGAIEQHGPGAEPEPRAHLG